MEPFMNAASHALHPQASQDEISKLITKARKRKSEREEPLGQRQVWCGGLFPALLAMLGFYFQSVGLHFATYSYVHTYAMTEAQVKEAGNLTTLHDPVEDLLPYGVRSIHLLDLLASLFPGLFAVTVFCILILARPLKKIFTGTSWRAFQKKALTLYTKVMLCAFFLFSFKGLLGACTTVPDSRGWETCKAQSLSPEAVEWMREDHTNPLDFWTLDFKWVSEHGKPMRYCADMMFSGHTFTVTLGAIGLYELVRVCQVEVRRLHQPPQRTTDERDRVQAKQDLAGVFIKVGLLTAIGVLTILQQSFEVVAIEVSHFHYTTDVVVAFMMTFLIYTNSVICVSAECWTRTVVDKFSLSYFKQMVGLGSSVGSNGSVAKAFDCDLENLSLEELELKSDLDAWVLDHMDSKADVFIPFCCVPFCCFSGREHMFSDDHVDRLMREHARVMCELYSYKKPNARALTEEEVYAHMHAEMKEAKNFRDGVTMQDMLKVKLSSRGK